MKIIRKDNSFAFDVDETLIIHCNADETGAIKFNFYGQDLWAKPHHEHIKLLKAAVARGRNTIVWSGNGYKWVVEVLNTLGLSDLDVIVMSKLIGYVDDDKIENFSGSRFYLTYEE